MMHDWFMARQAPPARVTALMIFALLAFGFASLYYDSRLAALIFLVAFLLSIPGVLIATASTVPLGMDIQSSRGSWAVVAIAAEMLFAFLLTLVTVIGLGVGAGGGF
jgi:hypothetical protein